MNEPKRWLIMMKPFNIVECEDGSKTQTRRTNKRYGDIKKGDLLFFRSNYKTTYKTASGPFIASEDARWESIRDISDADCKAEGIFRYHGGWAHEKGKGCDASPQLAFRTLIGECSKKPIADDEKLCRIAWDLKLSRWRQGKYSTKREGSHEQ